MASDAPEDNVTATQDAPAQPAKQEPSPPISPGRPSPRLKKMMTKTVHAPPGVITRQQMMEYLSLQKWGREAAFGCPWVVLLWMNFLALVVLHSHTETSYELRRAMERHVANITANPMKGIPPQRVANTGHENTITCKCACARVDATIENICDSNPNKPEMEKFYGTVDTDQYLRMRSASKRLDVQQSDDQVQPLSFKEVQSIPNLYTWIQQGFLPDVWAEDVGALQMTSLFSNLAGDDPLAVKATSSATDTSGAGWMMGRNRIIGGVRMRQVRLEAEPCTADDAIMARYQMTCHSNTVSTEPFGPAVDSKAEGFLPSILARSFDFYLDIGRPLSRASENIEYLLKPHNWIDDATDSLSLQAVFFNGDTNPPVIGMLSVNFVMERSGNIVQTVDVTTVSMNLYPTSAHYLPDVMWVLLMIVLLIGKIWQLVRYLKHKLGADFPFEWWSLLDWVTVFIGFCSAAYWAFLNINTSRIITEISKVPAVPSAESMTEEIEAYHAAWGGVIDTVAVVIERKYAHRLTLFGLSILLILRFFEVFRCNPRMAVMTKVLINSVEDLIHYVVLFLVIFLNFAFGGYLIWGLRLYQWSSPARSVNASFKAMMGDVDLPAMYEVAPISSLVWFFLFATSLIFIMLNLLFAIGYDHYTMVKEEGLASTTIPMQMSSLCKDMWRRYGGMALLKCMCIRDPVPSIDTIIEDLETRAHLTDEEKHMGRIDTVLGVKQQVHHHVHEAYASKTVENAHTETNYLHCEVEPDLHEMKLDYDYMTHLLEECERYRQEEYDPEEMEEEQLYEITALVDHEMLVMRERLAGCRQSMKLNMYGLTRRLESLETAVHGTLEDLVVLADAAGVPDLVEGQAPQMASQMTAKSAGNSWVSPDNVGLSMSNTFASMHRPHHRALMAVEDLPSGAAAPSTYVENWELAARAVETKKYRKVRPQPRGGLQQSRDRNKVHSATQAMAGGRRGGATATR
eukprot:gnl/TRDRNA2_/TRDRNA2_181401_c0_seq1.p1 gnl/TRDRNA2_/TRDRNA2_181401_c0~~gnl/TRDRNA2_/TRDRNA2_181401_c0_seq1.p1  ORF type:complete len:969 (+),score=169.84 gnl/TRDRNA2_/TRDRNA2_181401_c0_seq1:83-2989(+)